MCCNWEEAAVEDTNIQTMATTFDHVVSLLKDLLIRPSD